MTIDNDYFASSSTVDSEQFNYPSGVQLPFILRHKVEKAKAKVAAEQQSSDASSTRLLKFMTNVNVPSKNTGNRELLQDQSFTAQELGTYITKSNVSLQEIQKQIQRGEEAYYEETFSHGNVFKGWEGYLDAKEATSQHSGPGPSGNRRVPQDFRWFSGSSLVTKNGRPNALATPLPPTAAISPRLLNKGRSSSFQQEETSLNTAPLAALSIATGTPVSSSRAADNAAQASATAASATGSSSAPQISAISSAKATETKSDSNAIVPQSTTSADTTTTKKMTTEEEDASSNEAVPMDVESATTITKKKSGRKRKVGE